MPATDDLPDWGDAPARYGSHGCAHAICAIDSNRAICGRAGRLHGFVITMRDAEVHCSLCRRVYDARCADARD